MKNLYKAGVLVLLLFLLFVPLIYSDVMVTDGSTSDDSQATPSSGVSIPSGVVVSENTGANDIIAKTGNFFSGIFNKVTSFFGGLGSKEKTVDSLKIARETALSEYGSLNVNGTMDKAQYSKLSGLTYSKKELANNKKLTDFVNKYKYTAFTGSEFAKIVAGFTTRNTNGEEIRAILASEPVIETMATTDTTDLNKASINAALKDYKPAWNNIKYDASNILGQDLKNFVQTHKEAFTTDQYNDITGGATANIFNLRSTGSEIYTVLKENQVSAGFFGKIKSKVKSWFGGDKRSAIDVATSVSGWDKYLGFLFGAIIGFEAFVISFLLKGLKGKKAAWFKALGKSMTFTVVLCAALYWILSAFNVIILSTILFFPVPLITSFWGKFWSSILIGGPWFALMPTIFTLLFPFLSGGQQKIFGLIDRLTSNKLPVIINHIISWGIIALIFILLVFAIRAVFG